MARRIAVLATTAATALGAAAPAAATPVDPMPRQRDVDHFESLWKQCRRSPYCNAGRHIIRHGVRFRWVSKDGKRHHWGVHPAYAHNLAKRIRHLRARMAQATAITSLTPYPGPDGTHWAIPWAIINCERDKSLGLAGIWGSYNPSGALGPYQLLGHGAPWPVRSEADKMEHHRIAAHLWNGGAGASAWVCAGLVGIG